MSRTIKTYYPILGLLGIKPMSGYEIRSWIEEYLGFFWSEGWGQIYPALKELEERGYISLQGDEPGKSVGKRPRRVFAITESGRAALERYLSAPPADETFRSELLLKIFFGSAAGGEVIRRHVEAELAKQRAIEACRTSLDAELDSRSAPDCDASSIKYWKYALRFGQMYNRFIQEWCESVLADMAKEGK
jgi:DNA-binding PadR family transcriptional regulator